MLYVHEALIVSSEYCYSDNHNSMLTCFIDSMNAFVSVIYRPPDSTVESFRKTLDTLQEKIDQFSNNNRVPDIYILGDFNLPGIDWDLCTPTSGLTNHSSDSCDAMIDFMDQNFLSQMIREPTRENNILDLIFTNKPQDIIECNIVDTQLSDHKMIELLLGYNPIHHSTEVPDEVDQYSFRAVDFHKANYEALNSDLLEIDWENLKHLCTDDADGSEFLELIRLLVLQLTLLHSPPKERPTGAPKSRKAREKYTLNRRRRKLNSRISDLKANNPTSQNIAKLTDEVNLLTYDIRDLVMNDLDTKEARAVATIKTNPRYFYSFAKRFAKVKSSVSPIRDEHGVLHNDPSEKAELLQDQYVRVFSDPTAANIEESTAHLNAEYASKLEDFVLTQDDIIKAIKELDPYSSTPDGDIPAKVLTACKENLSLPLLLLWKDSFDNGIIPSCLKTQYITPVYKKGDRTKAANYRPISITSHLIKIFERVVRKHLVTHMESNGLLSESQHGFRKRRSCLTQLLDHVDNILKCLNSGDEVDVIYLDYAKAFDKVDHNILLAKLKRYGIDGKLFDWIEQFLTERVQTVVVEGRKSTLKLVLSGVPQGTVLGPILFIMYIDDQIEALISSKGLSFADDTKLLRRICDILSHILLQEDLINIIHWSQLNNMLLNETKFEVVNYHLNKSIFLRNLPFTVEHQQYTLPDGTIIEPTPTVRDLGVLLSEDCSWSPHIHQMLQSARTIASWVLSVFRDRSPLLMLTLFKAMVRSKLEYCCPVWNPAKIGDIQDIESVQRNFTRRITSCRDLNYWERLEKLGILSLQRRRERYIIIHTWKIFNETAPNNIGMSFKQHQRQGMKAIVPSFNTKSQSSVATHYDNSFGVKAARLWNILPKTVNEKTTLDSFKVALGNYIEKYPDTPPTKGYTATNNNSLLEWNAQRGSTVGGRT